MNKDCSLLRIKDLVDVVLCDLSLALKDYLVTLDRYNFTCILIYEVLIPRLQYTSCKCATKTSLKVLLVYLDLLCEVKELKNLLITLIADSTEKCCYRQLLLTVDVSEHDIVDVSCELNPRTLEWDDTCRIEHSTIGMSTLTEEYAWRTVKL